jgi:hypothetical protein
MKNLGSYVNYFAQPVGPDWAATWRFAVFDPEIF